MRCMFRARPELNNNLLLYGCASSAKKPKETKSKENEQTLADLSSAHRRSQAKCQLVKNSYI